jgi:hypothetical protein
MASPGAIETEVLIVAILPVRANRPTDPHEVICLTPCPPTHFSG